MAYPSILVIFAGPNGSGKTTTYEAFTEVDPALASFPFINPDLIAKSLANEYGFNNVNELPDELKSVVDLKAGKIALQRREELLKSHEDGVIETTASSRSILKLIDQAHEHGYFVDVNFIVLISPKLNILRVKERVKDGVHFVAPEVIERRYERAKGLIAEICVKVDTFALYDNSTEAQIKLLEKKDGKILASSKHQHHVLDYVVAQLKEMGVAVEFAQ